MNLNCSRRSFVSLALAGGVGTIFDSRLFASAVGPAGDKTILFGASAFALGVALAHPERTVIVERGIHLAPEFSQVGDWTDLGQPKTEEGRRLMAALAGAGLLKEGRLELPPLSDFLQTHLASRGLSAFFNAELVGFAKGKATVYGGGASGLTRVSVARLLDTTSVGWKNRGLGDVDARTFSAITNRGLHTVRLAPDADFRAARIKLYDDFAANGKGAKILAETNALGCVYRDPTRRIVRSFAADETWVPSAQFPTFMDAFEGGLAWNLA